jgi:hypothetical protein
LLLRYGSVWVFMMPCLVAICAQSQRAYSLVCLLTYIGESGAAQKTPPPRKRKESLGSVLGRPTPLRSFGPMAHPYSPASGERVGTGRRPPSPPTLREPFRQARGMTSISWTKKKRVEKLKGVVEIESEWTGRKREQSGKTPNCSSLQDRSCGRSFVSVSG